MKARTFLGTLFLLILGGTINSFAQTAVTVGSQVTSESDLTSGNAYLVYYVGNGSSGYMKDTGSTYTGLNDSNPTTAAVYYFTDNGDGTWKVQNFYTGKYWPVPPTTNVSTTVSSETAGSYTLNFQSGGNLCPSAPDANNTIHSWNRSSNRVHLWSSGTANVNQLRIYEIALSSTALSEFTNKDIVVGTSEVSSIETDTWYVMSQRSRTSYAFEDVSAHKLMHTLTAPSGSAISKANYLVRLASGDDGKYYLQTGLGNYIGQITASTNVPTTALKEEQHTVAKIGSTDGHFYVQSETGGVILDANDFSNGDPSTVVGWGTTVPTSTGGNNDWAFYPITLTDSWTPTASEVYTISHANRGSIIYNPNASTQYVWSSGKSGTFSATDANSQWVIIPTDTDDQYYLYNVGAEKFAIPSGTASTASWIFSTNAVAVTFIQQTDGTYKIKTAASNTYAAISIGYTGPIINYNDNGGNFTITQVDDADESTAATAAVARLVDSQTASSEALTGDGWYAIRIKTHNTYSDYYLFAPESEITYSGTNYALGFYSAYNLRPSIANTTYYTHITKTSSGYTWQLPNGRYLYNNVNKFPVTTADATSISIDYSNSGFRFYHNNGSYTRYAVPYLLSSKYFIGETANTGNAYYDIYPIDLSDAGLTAWQVSITNGSSSTQLTCARSDVNGLTSVYNNGYFFLPSDVVPTASDFSMAGMISCSVDEENHTINATFDETISLLAEDISVIQGNQVTGKGNTMQALLRIKTTPFADFTPTQFNISLTGADNVDKVTVYSTSIDQLRATDANPLKLGETEASEGTLSIPVSASLQTAGSSLYYWITADVKSDATEWDIIDAAITSIDYENAVDGTNSVTLSSIGNPDGEMRIYKSQTTIWTSSLSNTQYYRIPALLKTGENTLLAFTDDRHASTSDLGSHKIDVLVKKSTDGGTTWNEAVTVAAGDGSSDDGYGYGDAAVAQAANGDIVCLMAAGKTSFSNGMLHIGYTKSSDGGDTWSTVTDLYTNGNLTNPHATDTTTPFTSTFVSSGHGITQTIANPGRIAFPALGKISSGTNEYIIYSDDNGETWTFTDNYGYSGADESKLVELNDGSLLMSIRRGGFNSNLTPRGYNRTTSTNVEQWGIQGTWDDLQANGCNSDLIYYSRYTDGAGVKDILFHTIVKRYSTYRYDLRLYMSSDQGLTWQEAFQLQPGWAAYSSMQVLDNGDLAILFEDGSIGNEDKQDCYDINYVTISSELLAEKIDELYPDPDTTEPTVKIIYSGNNETKYGSWNDEKSIWTSNATSGFAGLTLSKSEGTLGNNYNTVAGYADLYYYLPSGTGTLTLTAPEGYIITAYSAKVRQAQTNEASYTVAAEDGTTINPPFAAAIESFTDFSVSDLNTSSTVITISNTNAANVISFANFTVQLAVRPITPGDIYGDDGVNETDLLYLVGYLVGTVSSEDINLEAADLNGDEVVTLADLTALVNLLTTN